MWNSAASNLLLSFPYHVFSSFFLSFFSTLFIVCERFLLHIICYLYIHIQSDISLMEHNNEKDLEIFSQIHITMYHLLFCGLFFSVYHNRPSRDVEVGMAWRNFFFSLLFFVSISKLQSHPNENFLISSSYYYETELNIHFFFRSAEKLSLRIFTCPPPSLFLSLFRLATDSACNNPLANTINRISSNSRNLY